MIIDPSGLFGFEGNSSLRALMVASFLGLCSTLSAAESLSGSIVFPADLATVPSLRIYYCGQKVPTDTFGSTIRFTANKESTSDRMYVLITTKIRPVVSARSLGDGQALNTIDHLTVPEGQRYKFYALIKDTRANGSSYWRVDRKLALNESRCIPDDTLIVLWRSDCIAKLDGSSGQAFPSVVCKNDMVRRFGSAQRLNEFAAEMWMEAINSDLFHAKRAKEKVRLVEEKKRVLRVVA